MISIDFHMKSGSACKEAAAILLHHLTTGAENVALLWVW